MPASRLIAIGDIHGCSLSLAALVKAVDPKPNDTIVTLGDYVDGGLDSKGALDQLIELEGRCQLVPLLGNHDEMMLGARGGRTDFRFWMNLGGIATLDSYGSTGQLNLVPRAHFDFLKRCRLYYESDRHFFVHANYDPASPLVGQDTRTLLWLSLEERGLRPHVGGKIAVVGHTPQMNGRILDMGHFKCLDTGCGYGGVLTALDVQSGQVWQIDERGQPLDST